LFQNYPYTFEVKVVERDFGTVSPCTLKPD